jgi:predicted phosphodiesterase
MHVRAPELLPEHPSYPCANEKAHWALECANGSHGFPRPDLVVSAGDIINGEIPDYHADFRYLHDAFLDRLAPPFLPCLGNHENRQGEGIAELNEAWDHWFGPNRHNYVFTYGGLAFVVIDTSGAHRLPDEVTAARNASAERALARLRGTPTLVVTHVPLIPMREESVLKQSFGFSSWQVLDPRLLEIVEGHAESVIGVLCGHIHLTGVHERRGIHHLMPGGTCGYPADFASLAFFADRVEVALHGAPEEWLDRQGNIHGRERHGVDYTDAEHPDHESYLWGSPQERRLTIPLAGARRPLADAPLTLEIWDP